jgi:hypothetical protein
MRVTRVDALGRPVPGLCSTVVTSGYVKVNMKAQVDSGDETTVKTAGGDLCVSEKACDQLKWLEVDIDFCSVDPDLFAMINPTWTKLVDYQGQTIGWEESHHYSCDAGIALEIWSDVSGYTPTDPNAEGAWVYYLLPFVVGGTLGDLTVENGAVTFALSGRTKKGNSWGRGPYHDIMANAPDGLCGPLITPMDPNAPRRIFLTTCAPPPAVCGCQPLSSVDGPAVTVAEVTSDTTRLTVHAYADGVGALTIDWGDGTVEDLPGGLVGKTHRYGAAGTYVIGVSPTNDRANATYTTLTVPFTGTTPSQPLLLSVTEKTSDATRKTATIAWDNTSFGTVRIDYGDGSPVASGQVETGTLDHTYPASGTYTLTITDETDSSRVATRIVGVPFGLLVTASEDIADSVDHRAVLLTVDNTGRGSVKINWGDGTAQSVNPGDNSTVSRHKFAGAGTYNITVSDIDEPSRTGSASVTVPYGPSPTVTEYTTDLDRMSVSAVVNNHGHGSVSIDWGDSSGVGTNVGNGTTPTTHQYSNEGTYTIVVTDTDNATYTASRTVTLPYGSGLALTATVAESSPSDASRRKVTLTWDNKEEGPVSILWGQPSSGETPTSGAVTGTLDHLYTSGGTFTITITDASNPSRTRTLPVTVPFP